MITQIIEADRIGFHKATAGHLLLPLPTLRLYRTFAEIPHHSCRLASHNIRVSFFLLLCKRPRPSWSSSSSTMIWIHAQMKSDWRPSSLTKACIATLLIILVRNNKTEKKKKEEVTRVKIFIGPTAHIFHNHTKTTSPASHCPLRPERTVPPEKLKKKKKRQQGTLLSCQLMINGSAPHLHHHRHNVPPLTTHTLFHCSQAGRCWATGRLRHCVDASPPLSSPVIWP